jgi:glycosyltransferase involved in cell wall biosynthesis
MSPLVSIIVPVYNAEAFIVRCLYSIIFQTYRNIEVILVDDGSSDNSALLCWIYADARTKKQVKVVIQDNRGPSAARNVGIERATGKYITFLDADDTLDTEAISEMVRAAQLTGADLVIGDYTTQVGKGKPHGHRGAPSGSRSISAKGLLGCAVDYLNEPNENSLFAYCWGRLFKREIIEKYNIRFPSLMHSFEDVIFNYYYLMHVQKAFFLKREVYVHRVHASPSALRIARHADELFQFTKAITAIKLYLAWAGDHWAGIEKAASRCEVVLSIVQVIRACSCVSWRGAMALHRVISKKLNENDFQVKLAQYVPHGFQSRLIPWLMRRRLVWAVLAVCYLRSIVRYGSVK